MEEHLLTIEQIKEMVNRDGDAYLRFVRLENGEYRFANGTDFWGVNHDSMVKEGEKAVSAAYIGITKKFIRLQDWSATLKLSWDNEDPTLLSALFGVPVGD